MHGVKSRGGFSQLNHVSGMETMMCSVCIINSLSGVDISSKPKAKRQQLCVIKYFCFNVSHITIATVNMLIACIPNIVHPYQTAL